MKKIAIIGAGVGGLALASLLDNKKYEIDVYEKKASKLSLGYNWEDDVNLKRLEKLGFIFNVDNEDEIWNIFSCSGHKINFISDKDEIAPLKRKVLSNELYQRAIKNSNIYFNSNVEIFGLQISVNKQETMDYDLIVDCRGCVNTSKKDIFFTNRILIEQPQKRIKRNIFLKPNHINGVAWCNYNENGIDILIGQVGKIHTNTTNNTLKFIENNMNIKIDKQNVYNKVYNIPVRYPSTSLFNNNCVLLGDSANMTVPMIGSGIINTIEASFILANVLNNSELTNDPSIRNKLLWQYQYEYFQKCGLDSTQIDVFKRWLLSTEESNVDFLFENYIVSPDDLRNIMTGRFIDYDIITLLDKIKRLKVSPQLTMGLAATLSKALLVKSLIKNMPSDYDETHVNNWEKSLTKILR